MRSMPSVSISEGARTTRRLGGCLPRSSFSCLSTESLCMMRSATDREDSNQAGCGAQCFRVPLAPVLQAQPLAKTFVPNFHPVGESSYSSSVGFLHPYRTYLEVRKQPVINLDESLACVELVAPLH